MNFHGVPGRRSRDHGRLGGNAGRDNIYRIDFSFSGKALPKFIDAVKKEHAVRCSFFDHTLSVSARILPDEIMAENHRSDFIITATLK